MDIVSCITAVASCITAIATAVTVLVAIHQFKKTLIENRNHWEEERYLRLKDKACLVDVWIAVRLDSESNEHVFIIENNSDAAVRDIELDCTWRKNENSEAVRGLPPLQLIPKGTWVISRNYDENAKYDWNFPKSVSRDELNKNYGPRFIKDKNHCLKSFQFTDVYETRWKREGDLNSLTKVQHA